MKTGTMITSFSCLTVPVLQGLSRRSGSVPDVVPGMEHGAP